VDNAGNGEDAPATPDAVVAVTHDTVAPTFSVTHTANANGWNKTSPVSLTIAASDSGSDLVAAPTCKEGTTPLALTGSAGNWTANASGEGTHAISCSVSDKAGNSITKADTVKIDTTAPGVTATPGRTADSDGWYNHAVNIDFVGTDALSGIDNCDPAVAYSGPDSGTASATGRCKDKAGNSASDTLTFKYDATAPTGVSGALARSADYNGWYNAPLGYSFSGSDVTSGIPASGCTSGTYSGLDGTGLSVSGSCTDSAGNSTRASTSAFKFDDTNPALNPVVSPNPVQLNGSATVNANPTDGTSGVDQASVRCGSVDVSSVGANKSVSCSAADNAGNSNSASANYSVVYGNGFLGIQQPINGGLTPSLTADSSDAAFGDDNSRFKLGSTVPVKFTLKDAAGALIPDAIAKLNVKKADNEPDAGVNETTSTLTATTGNLFRYDATSGQYVFNLSTKSAYTNPNGTTVTAFSQGTWTLTVILQDGTSRSVNIQLVK
jgi:hypothetical protein